VAVVANVVAVMPAATSAMLVAINAVLAAYPDAPLKNAAPPAPQRIAVPALLPHVVPPVLLVGAPRRLAAALALLDAPQRLAALALLDAPRRLAVLAVRHVELVGAVDAASAMAAAEESVAAVILLESTLQHFNTTL